MKTQLHNCTQCHGRDNNGSHPREGDIDCATCKLAMLGLEKGERKESRQPVSDDDYSISGELTQKGNDYSILYLVIAGAATLAFVVFFTWLFR